MHIVEIMKLEDCFDGSAVCRYRFEAVWTREEILALRSVGEVQYFPDFPRPYFRMSSAQGLIVQGVEGELSCRVTLPRRDREQIRRRWEAFFTAATTQRSVHGAETCQTVRIR